MILILFGVRGDRLPLDARRTSSLTNDSPSLMTYGELSLVHPETAKVRRPVLLWSKVFRGFCLDNLVKRDRELLL